MKVQIRRNERTAWLALPASESAMQSAGKAVCAVGADDSRFILSRIEDCPDGLHRLEGQTLDLDHLNLLARVIDGMTDSEVRQFGALLYLRDTDSLKEIVNLSQNLQAVTLAEPGMSYEKLGFNHLTNLRGPIPVKELESIDPAAVGEELLRSGRGIETPFGTAFENEAEPFLFFDGKHMPAYYDRNDYVFAVFLEKDEEKEFLFLPCPDSAVSKALRRLGVKDAQAAVEEYGLINPGLPACVKACREAGIRDLNRLAADLSGMDAEQLEKFTAAVRFADCHDGVESARDLVLIAENPGAFRYVPGVTGAGEYGEYLIRESGEYRYDECLRDYYDYAGLGKDRVRMENGLFLESGYVGMDPEAFFEEPEDDETESEVSGMGGMA